MKLFLVYNFSTGCSNDGSQDRQGPRQFKHLSPLRAHLHGTVLERPAAREAPSASPSIPWRPLLQAEGQAGGGKTSLRAQGISPGEQVNPLVILALPAKQAHFEVFMSVLSNAGVITLLYSSHKILCRTHPSAWTDN